MGQTEVTWTTEGERPLGDDAVVRAVDVALEVGGRPGHSLSIVFVDDAFLARMHGEHLGDWAETDVMAFDLGSEGRQGPEGEVYVSVDRARIVAARRGVSATREPTLYIVHGVLHLSGFDDGTEEERSRMRAAESRVLRSLGFDEDSGVHEFGAD